MSTPCSIHGVENLESASTQQLRDLLAEFGRNGEVSGQEKRIKEIQKVLRNREKSEDSHTRKM